MRKQKFITEQQRHKLLEHSGVNAVQGANVFSIDIQPEYKEGFGFYINDFTKYINQNIDKMNSLTFFYNGSETVGTLTEQEYMYWLFENGLDERVIDHCKFYDKGYAFFRTCMDEDIDDDDIVALVRYMMSHDINDSRDIDEDMWNDFMTETGADQSDVRDLLELSENLIDIPDLMEYIERYNGKIVMCGGGIYQCLKEVEIAMMVLDKPYNLLPQFIY